MIIILILGIVQGITEFLPISSSAHLVVLQTLYHFNESQRLSYTAFLHLGTTLSLLYFFRKRIITIIYNLFNYTGLKKQKYDLKLILMIIIGTIPIAILGFFANDKIEQYFQLPKYSAIFLLFTGIILFMTRFVKEKNLKINYKYAIIIGVAQAVALLPGISRSGITISVALLLGLSHEDGFEFSFLLSIPAIIGANILLIKEIKDLSFNLSIIALISSILIPFLFGLLALYLLKKILINKKLYYFAFYCWIVGILTLIFLK